MEKQIDHSKSHNVVEILEYTQDSVISKTILSNEISGNSLNSSDRISGFIEKKSPFNTFIQMIYGKVKIMIGGQLRLLETGDGIIIPARQSYSIEEMDTLTSVRL